MDVIGQFGLHMIVLLISASSSSSSSSSSSYVAAANNISSIAPNSNLVAKFPVAKPGCRETCGNITIPFPFGMGPLCYLNDWYEIECNNATQIPSLKKLGLEVLQISLPDIHDTVGFMRVSLPISYSSWNCTTSGDGGETTDLRGSSFYYSQDMNSFLVAGCNKLAFLNDTRNALVGCQTSCDFPGSNSNLSSIDLWEIDTCMNTIPSNLQAFNIEFQRPEDGQATNNSCSYAMLMDQSGNYSSGIQAGHAPVMLEWEIANMSDLGLAVWAYSDNSGGNSYNCLESNGEHAQYCYCVDGFNGNAYLVDGCQDIDECQDPQLAGYCPHGTCVNTRGHYSCTDSRRTIKLVLISIGAVIGAFLLLFLGRWVYKAIKRRKQLKLKQKFFKQNGGLLLQQQLSSPQGNIEKGKLFNSKELEKATDNFSDDRILGQGGQGTVYKGMLTDGTIVAIKKSKLLDEGYVEQFINEVFILSQINHRNVVKLLGCCLETEVPLLVYEFIPNGTIYQYLHNPDGEFLVSWEVRMRLAAEVAGALAYLHSAASIPIFHRDIKTTNILLDEKYRAKIADFGTSKSVALDQTHVTTLVQGTFRYLDPEYFQSCQFIDKSDVYSFGVVLVELLTGQKPIFSLRAEEGRSLSTYFILSMEANRIFDIIDTQVLNQGKKEEIIVVADLARRCLHLNGRNRPTMREVAIGLEGVVKKPQQRYYSELQNQSNGETAKIEAIEVEAHAAASFKSIGSNSEDYMTCTWDVSPLLSTESW